jgi:DHA1 family multidrug resistance protein-like MFS transporter
MKASNRKNIAILAFALIVVMLGYGMVIPLYPFYVAEMGAGGSQLGLLVALSALTELLFGPLWGSLSDRAGRKPILLLGLFGYSLSALLTGLSTQLWMLYAARALSGVLSAATSSTALAYVSDSTAERDRGGGLGMLGAAVGLGLILGPAVGGWLGSNSLSLPFFIAAGSSLLALVLAALWLPESLPAEARRAQSAGPVAARFLSTARFRPADRLRSASRVRSASRALFGPLGLLLFLLFLVSFALANFESVFGLYAAQELGYGPQRVGTLLAVVGLASTLGKALLIGPLTRRWSETPIIRVSLAASAAGFIFLLLAATYPAVLLATGVFILSKTLLRTLILSLASKRASPGASGAQHSAAGQGTTMGLGNSSMNLGRIVGPIWAGSLYDVNASLPYLSGAAVMLAGFVISLLWIAPRPAGDRDCVTPTGARSQL